ncbi:DNA-binding transcriptional LysR family regulator [Sphingobium wenxiniae]|uniref:DNA-binding transcriptional LysR family regulator n=1 Tax=Sphingobium wenxiniae (strain DSM 21828 / CGMCC 1.7748 / JZ-1) TaxID=595605 RepID=A0A562JU54_SPHWJ|nr:LysR family transcriptional regulator [Sphingobium wenxiniae]MBB6193946.1 DNA-binding transcriptional LysR family regulator [Sphingobium wenxiniae]TWH86710.1 DNA-binding transcriptional LysR family regulator [Sphingobium wenxiniae]SCW94676.1 DNA-binding transcriptional regulator, LysR family [Sphingobium faniae]
MQLSRADLADFAYFIAIAKHRSFRRAAQEMGVTTSALSHSMSALETRRGVRLLNRTTRSVTLTAAGEELLDRIEGPLNAINDASENLDRYRDTPAGRVRISVPEDAVTLLLNPVMPTFIERYPHVEVDISVSNRLIDVIGSGFDAGIRYGGTVPEDMIAQRLSPDIGWMAAAAPSYIEQFGLPEHPSQLVDHRCVRIRLGNDQIYQWEFDRGEESVVVTAPGPLTVDATHAALGLGLGGCGIIYGSEPIFRPYFKDGRLLPVMADWMSLGSGFHIYYSGRRHVPTGVRLLVELIRNIRPL